MRWIVAAVVASVTMVGFAACNSPGEDANAGGGLCPLELELDGVTYASAPKHRALTLASPLTQATFTDCLDGTQDEGKSVPSRRLRGVDEATAFAAQLGGKWMLFLAEDIADPCQVKYVRC